MRVCVSAIVLLLLLAACGPGQGARPTDAQVREDLKRYIGTGIAEQWKVNDLVTVTEVLVVQTSTSGRVCHVRARGTVLFHQMLGPQNILGFGGLEGQRKHFNGRLNFLRENHTWRLESVRLEEIALGSQKPSARLLFRAASKASPGFHSLMASALAR